MDTNSKSKGKLWLTVAVGVVALVALLSSLTNAIGSLTTEASVNHKEYQALFLTNGQVYFGKLSNVTRDYVKIRDIYYLQVQQPVQPGDSKQASTSLVKLGSELHGPEDVMYVKRDQVLFWENLKDDGKVVQAIKSDKK